MGDEKVVPLHKVRSKKLGKVAGNISRILKKGEKKTVLIPHSVLVDGENGEYCYADWKSGNKCPSLVNVHGSPDLHCTYFPPYAHPEATGAEKEQAYQFLYTDSGEVARWDVDQPRRCNSCLEAESNAEIVRQKRGGPPPDNAS